MSVIRLVCWNTDLAQERARMLKEAGVSVDASPQELHYVRSGHVQLLLSQDVYGYGYRAVEHLVNKLHFKKDPPRVIDDTPLTPVTSENVETFARNWEKWLPK